MPNPEGEPTHRLLPNELPEDLADFLKQQPKACLLLPTDQGTVMVIKAPGRDIESARGRVPMQVRHELYDHPSAPVIRMVVTLFDWPRSRLALETFVNVEDPQQRADYAALAGQPELSLLFFDEQVHHRLSKGTANTAQEEITRIVRTADALFARIPREKFDFDAAKADVMRATSL